MVGDAIAGLGALKTAFDLAKGLKDIHDTAIRNAAVIELQERILAAQQTQSSLAQRIRELEEEMARFEAWDAEKQRYELTEIAPGAFAYSVKKEARGTEPHHWLCAACFQKRKKSLLQAERRGVAHDVFGCHDCGSKLSLPGTATPPTFTPRNPGGGWMDR